MTVLYSLNVFTNFCLSCKNHNETVGDAKKKFAPSSPSSPSSDGLAFRYFYLLPVFSSLFQNFHFCFVFFFFDEKKTRLHLNQVHCCHPRSQKIFSLVSNVKDVASYLLS